MPHAAISREFFNQLKNGVDFSLNPSESANFLLGIVGERMQAIHVLDIFWNATATAFDSMSISNSGAVDTIVRQGQGWDDIEFSIGDSIEVVITSTQVSLGFATVLSITGTSMDIDTIGLPFYPQTLEDVTIHGLTPLTGVEFSFGLIENQEAINYNSKIDTQVQYYYAFGVGNDLGGGVRDTTPVVATAGGPVNSWKHGNVEIAYISTTPDDRIQRFSVTHEFIVLPWYLDGQDANLQNPINQPPLFDLGQSMRYVFSAIFHDITTNPNNAHFATLNDMLGDVGYFEERFNNFQPVYSITSFEFTDTLSTNIVGGVQLSAQTTVEIVVASDDSTFSVDDKFAVFISYLPEAPDYQGANQSGLSTFLEENFLYENVLNQVGQPLVNGTILTSVIAVLDSAAQITITADIEYTLLQQSQIDPTRNVVVWVMVANDSYNTATSDRMALLVSVGGFEFNADVPDLLEISDKSGYYEHDQLLSVLNTDYKGWVEDGVLYEAQLKLNISLNARMLSYKWRFVAWNTTTDDIFDLETYDMDLSATLIIPAAGIVPEYQQFLLGTSRGFQLGPNDVLNTVRLFSTSANLTFVEVLSRFGFKVRWEEWIALPGANNVFVQGGQDHFGLNLRSSNYSMINGYGLYVFCDFLMSDGNSLTQYRIINGEVETLYYDDDGAAGADWNATIETFNQASFNLQGNLSLQENTKVIATFNYTGTPPMNVVDDWGIIRIDVDQGSQLSISEISTIQPIDVNSPLIPLPGETQCKLTIGVLDVTLECEVDYTKLLAGNSYFLSARLGGQQV